MVAVPLVTVKFPLDNVNPPFTVNPSNVVVVPVAPVKFPYKFIVDPVEPMFKVLVVVPVPPVHKFTILVYPFEFAPIFIGPLTFVAEPAPIVIAYCPAEILMFPPLLIAPLPICIVPALLV